MNEQEIERVKLLLKDMRRVAKWTANGEMTPLGTAEFINRWADIIGDITNVAEDY